MAGRRRRYSSVVPKGSLKQRYQSHRKRTVTHVLAKSAAQHRFVAATNPNTRLAEKARASAHGRAAAQNQKASDKLARAMRPRILGGGGMKGSSGTVHVRSYTRRGKRVSGYTRSKHRFRHPVALRIARG